MKYWYSAAYVRELKERIKELERQVKDLEENRKFWADTAAARLEEIKEYEDYAERGRDI